MARSKSEVERIREHLSVAAGLASETRPDVAETLLALRKDYRVTPRVAAGTTNLALMVPDYLRKAIQDAAVDAAPSDTWKLQELLGSVVSAGIPKVLSGEVRVRDIPRDPRGSGVQKVAMNVSVASDVLDDLRQEIDSLGERLGFQGKPSVSKVALRLLLDEYGLDYEPVPNEFRDLAQMQLHVPPRLARAIRKKLDLVDANLRSLIEEGYVKVLAGSWQPFKIPKAAKGSDYERDLLPVRVKSDLLDKVRAKCPELKQELGYRVTPPTIAIDYLIDQLGLQELADTEYGVTAP